MASILVINGQAINDNDNFDQDPNFGIIQLTDFVPANSPSLSVTAQLRLETDPLGSTLVLTNAIFVNSGDLLTPVKAEFSVPIPKLVATVEIPLALSLHLAFATGDDDEIYLYDASTDSITEITTVSGMDEEAPQIDQDVVIKAYSGGGITWEPFATHLVDTGFLLPDFPGLIFAAPPDIVVVRDDIVVTGLGGELNFDLEPDHALVLPASASVSAHYVPEPAAILTWGGLFGLAALVACIRRRRKRPA
jgi:hypothetical protein